MTRRLIASYLAITLAVLGVLTPLLGRSVESRRLGQLTNRLVLDAFLMASQVEESVDTAAAKPNDSAWIRSYTKDTALRVVVVNRDGKVVIDSSRASDTEAATDSNMASRPEFVDLFSSRKVQTGRRFSNDLNVELAFVVVPVVKADQLIGAVRLTFPTTAVRQDVVTTWKAIAAIAVVSLLLVAVIGIVLSRYIAGPIKDLERAAVEFGDGQLDRRATVIGGPPEVVSLRNAFNQTASGLETLVKRQQAFVADASHQLRTPLTGLRLRLENLEGEVTDYGRDDLEQALVQTDRLSRMVDGLLTLARADRPATWNDSQPLLLQPFLAARVTDWEPFASERSIRLSVTCQPGLMALSHPDRLSQVLDNLIANAFDALGKVERSNPNIRLVAWPDVEHVDIHVLDNGPGLPPTERERAFDRFWRADPNHRDGFGGTGLGLSIAASMLAADRGTIRLDEADGGGLDAVIRLHRGDVAPRRATTKLGREKL